ncbi:MAG: hypothetical protein KDB41_05640 [Propionibacteriaceae bacterium]|nr:hypothetical protein [Propionibacteriaceae bacterium]
MTAGRRRAEPARGGLAPGRRWAGLRLALATAVGFLAATSTLAASAQAGVAQQFRDLKSTRLTASSSTMRPGWVTDAQLANTAALRRALGQPRHVVLVQVLAETVICGAAGGFLGALAGQLAAGAIAIGQGWPPVAQAGLVPLSALAGAVVGAVAGAYPAHVASTTDPSETLKTG